MTAEDTYKYVVQHEKGAPKSASDNFRFVIHSTYNFLGASPDGVVYDTDTPEPNGLCEMKCPYQFQDTTSMEAISQKEFCACSQNETLV